jgi:hypothetical protein
MFSLVRIDPMGEFKGAFIEGLRVGKSTAYAVGGILILQVALLAGFGVIGAKRNWSTVTVTA